MPNPSTIAAEEEADSAEDVRREKSVGEGIEIQFASYRSDDDLLKFLEAEEEHADALRCRVDQLITDKVLMHRERYQLRDIAVAANRFLLARLAFDEAEVPTDAQTEEAAESECDLMVLLNRAGYGKFP